MISATVRERAKCVEQRFVHSLTLVDSPKHMKLIHSPYQCRQRMLGDACGRVYLQLGMFDGVGLADPDQLFVDHPGSSLQRTPNTLTNETHRAWALYLGFNVQTKYHICTCRIRVQAWNKQRKKRIICTYTYNHLPLLSIHSTISA